MEERSSSISQTLNRIEDLLEQHEKEKKLKKFRLPFKARVGRGKVKKGWATILYLKTNKGARFLKAPIVEGVVEIDNIPHTVTPENVLVYKNKPLIIVPEWTTEPYSPSQEIKKAEDNKSLSFGWRLLANYLESERITQRRKFAVGALLFGILVIGALVYYVFQGGF